MKSKFPLVLSLTIALSLTAPSAQAAVKKPSAPTITSVTSSAVKKGLVDVVVSISLPSNNGGSKILGSQVTGSGKSCTISATKTSCTLKGITKGASLSLKASSKNKIGFGKIVLPLSTRRVAQPIRQRRAHRHLVLQQPQQLDLSFRFQTMTLLGPGLELQQQMAP